MSGLVSAFALALTLAGLAPFALVALDWRNVVYGKHHVEVLKGLHVLYVFLGAGAAGAALGLWVLFVQTATANICGLLIAGAAGFLRQEQLVNAVQGLRDRVERA